MREASIGRTAIDTDSHAFVISYLKANDGSPAASKMLMKCKIRAILSLLCIATISQTALAFRDGQFEYYPISETEVSLYRYYPNNNTSPIDSLVIPETAVDSVNPTMVKSYTVTVIEGQFGGVMPNLQSLTIPNSITTIGPYCFGHCQRLTSVKIGFAISSIGNYAFAYCPITDLNIDAIIPPKVDGSKTFSKNIFTTCELTIPTEAIKNYKENTYWGNFFKYTKIGDFQYSIDFEKNTASAIGYLGNKEKVKVLSFPSTITHDSVDYSVTEINLSSGDMPNLTELSIPSSVTKIGNKAFSNCPSLKDITWADNLNSIGSNAFYRCSSITGLKFPDSLKTIGSNAFSNCEALQNISFGSSIEEIESKCFYGCPNIKQITLTATAPPSATNAFSRNTCVDARLNIPEENAYKESESWKDFWIIERDNDIYYELDKDKATAKVTYMCAGGDENYEGLSSVEIAESITHDNVTYTVTKIGKDAFSNVIEPIYSIDDEWVYPSYSPNRSNNSHIKSIVLPSSILEIEENAFAYCDLEEIKLNEGLKMIGECAFESSELEKITIPSSVSSIQNKAFSDCSKLREVILGNGLKLIGENAFYSCSELSKVTSLNPIPPIISSNTFEYSTYREASLFVPEEAYYNYKAAQYWSSFEQMETSGLDNIITDINYAQPIEIYDLKGIKIGVSTNNLDAGVYIVRQGAKTRKIIVK